MRYRFLNRDSSDTTALIASFLLTGLLVAVVPFTRTNAGSEFEGFEDTFSKQDFVHHGDGADFIHTNRADEAYKGKRALKIVSSTSVPKERKLTELKRWITPIKKHSVAPDQQVRMDVYLKTASLDDTANISLSFFSDRGDGTWGDAWVKTATSAKQLKGTNDWTKLSLISTAPAGAEFVRPEFRLWGAGTLWIDNFTFEILDKEKAPEPTTPEEEASNGSVVTPEDPPPSPIEPTEPTLPSKEGEVQGAIRYEGEKQYNTAVIPFDEVVRTSLHGINKGKGQQLFTVDCLHSHYEADDPIVFPGQSGASHSHEFFGDTSVNADSTTQGILDYEGNTCEVGADRSAYWVPAAYQDGKPIRADNNKFYYKVGQVDPKTIQPMPVGLRMIAGNAKATEPQSKQINYYFATTSNGKFTEPKTQLSSSNPNLFTIRPDENGLRIHIKFPQCWDGEYLWLPKTAHMAYPTNGKCPESHPVPLLQLMFNLGYSDAVGGPGFKLSSGEWYTAHADFINGWKPETLEPLVDTCLRAKRYCGLTMSHKGNCLSLAAVRAERMGCIEFRDGNPTPRFFGREYN